MCGLLTRPQQWPLSPGPFVFAVDHCFPIKGQGTVMTGTVLQGGTRIGEVGVGRHKDRGGGSGVVGVGRGIEEVGDQVHACKCGTEQNLRGVASLLSDWVARV